jgi:hypothetical protein
MVAALRGHFFCPAITVEEVRNFTLGLRTATHWGLHAKAQRPRTPLLQSLTIPTWLIDGEARKMEPSLRP